MMGMLAINCNSLWISNFAVRPGKLFTGVDMNLSILIGSLRAHSSRDAHTIFSTALGEIEWVKRLPAGL
jgi:hypothetical protein